MTSRDWNELMHRRLDGELTEEETRSLDEAQLHSEDVRREMEDLEEIHALIGEVGRTERPALDVRPEPAPGSGVHARTGRLGRGVAVAAAALVAVSIWLAWPRGGVEGPVSERGPEPGGAELKASLEIRDPVAAESTMVVALPSRHDDVHVFWVYPSES